MTDLSKQLLPHFGAGGPKLLCCIETLLIQPSVITMDTLAWKWPHEPTPDLGQEKESHPEDQPLPRKRVYCVIKSDDDKPSVDAKVTAEIKPTVIRPGKHQVTDIPGLSVGRLRAVMPPTQSTALNHDGGKSPAGGPKPHPRAGDYNGPTCHTLDTAIEFYHAILLTEIPFPQSHVEVEWAKSAWDLSCQFYYGTDTKYNPDILKLAIPLGKFRPPLVGIYQNKGVQQVINEVLFKNKTDEGIKWPEYYQPFPIAGYALTLTVASRSCERITFTEEAYMPIYNAHIDNLEFFHKSTQMLNILQMIMRRVYDNRKLHAGIPIARPANSVTISAAVINDVINEFDLEHKQGTDKKQDNGVSTDEADDWQDEVEEAGHEWVELVCYIEVS
ncbi:hypothetical protein HD554DRAFT_2042413 [Boletus coccyginus]|nr:hypothetical protein HD554DRAFT_2042413 [Boletus coccyginus]